MTPMDSLANKRTWVLGLGPHARLAAVWLHRHGARVTVWEPSATAALRIVARELQAVGVAVQFGPERPALSGADLAVITPSLPDAPALQRWLDEREVPYVGELELAYQQARCLSVAVTGANGKSTVVSMLEQVLASAQRRVRRAGDGTCPLCEVVDGSRDLDLLLLNVSATQLTTARFFRPVVGIMTNLAPHPEETPGTLSGLARACGRIFANQQVFDWAIVQSEALAHLRSLGQEPPGKIITYSAQNQRADLVLDRGLLISRWPGWTGPLLDMSKCRVRGVHQAENLMATLAAGHVLRVPLEGMVRALMDFEPAAHHGESVGVRNGACYVDDSSSRNLLALQRAVEAAPRATGTEQNVLVLSGGREEDREFHDLGPLLSRRAKHAFVLGQAARRMQAAWSLFTPCTVVGSLLEAVEKAAAIAVPDDVVLFSPACASFETERDVEQRAESFRKAVGALASSASEASSDAAPRGASTSKGSPDPTRVRSRPRRRRSKH